MTMTVRKKQGVFRPGRPKRKKPEPPASDVQDERTRAFQEAQEESLQRAATEEALNVLVPGVNTRRPEKPTE